MNPQMNKIITQITADKKKLGIMICLLAVGLLLWGRLLLKDVPRTATADPVAAAALDAAQAASAKPSKAESSRKHDVTVVVDLPSVMTRDVFVLNATGYRVVKNDEPSRMVEKTPVHTPDKAYRIEQAKQAARDLSLDGVVLGEDPSVIINGRLLQVGQTIETFTVRRIEEQKVVLEMDGVLIALRMSM